jgi:calpain-15
VIFKDSTSPNDIKQGKLGNCYLLAALATLSEWPGRVEKIFAATKTNKKQLFGVHLYTNGVYKTIWMDNQFPVFNRMVNGRRKPNGELAGGEGEPIFASAFGNELWVALAEKAWAKAHGGWMITAGGFVGLTITDFTGAPSWRYNF